MKSQNNFWSQNAFLTCSWRFRIANKLEQLEFKLEKIIGIQKHAGKFRKYFVTLIRKRPGRIRKSVKPFFQNAVHTFTLSVASLVKSTQYKQYAKCFAFHILKFEILQITLKKIETKNIRPLVFSFSPLDEAF